VDKVVVVETVRGRDGRRYPAGLPRPRAELNRLRWLAHHLVCRDGLTIRAAQRVMLESYGIRRSTGIIHRDLQAFECPDCADQGTEPDRGAGEVPTTDQAVRMAEWAGETSLASSVHQSPGGLTGMVGSG
jgi:hypothetical protein